MGAPSACQAHGRTAAFRLLAAWVVVGCAGDGLPKRTPPVECSEVAPDATPRVAGLFDYASQVSPVYGTIRFEQTGDEVRVTDTTYANANDRALEGTGALEGNRLRIVLAPKNGDTDYEAEVDFVFAEDGDTFCLLAFTDTNGDEGGPGSHYGRRR